MTDQPRSARPRNAEATKATILAAARGIFTRCGYEGAGMREVAAAAGVNVALVSRYFGSKDGLFVAAAEHPFDLAGLLAGDRAGAGRRLAQHVLAKPPPDEGFDPLLMLTRSSPGGPAAALFRDLIANQFVRPLAAWLGGDHASERASLIAAHLLGLAVTRGVVGVQVEGGTPEVTLELAGFSLQTLIDPPAVGRAEGGR